MYNNADKRPKGCETSDRLLIW